MEREPILFAWQTAARHHALALILAFGVGGPLALVSLLCLRDLVGVLAAPRTGMIPFLQIAVTWPGLPDPIVLVPGWSLPMADLTVVALGGLALAATAAAGLGWAVARLCFHAQTRALGRLNNRVTDAILRAPAAARDEVRGLTQLVGQLLAKIDTLFGLVFLAPALTLGSVLLALLLATLASPRLLPVVTLGLLAAGLTRALILRRSQARVVLRRKESAAAERAFADLVRRMPAVRAHGAAAFESARLTAKGQAARVALTASESALAFARAPSMALGILLPAIVVAAALWRGPNAGGEAVDIGALAALGAACVLAVAAMSLMLRMWFVYEAIAPVFGEIVMTLRGLDARLAPRIGTAAFPKGGPLAASGVGAYDPVSGERLSSVTCTVSMPGHVAIIGGAGSGSRALAALLAGQLEPTAGAVLYAGTDLRAFDSSERARRIAFAGAEAILIEGTLRQNILYGAAPEVAPAEADLIAVLRQTGLDGFVYARGLEGTVDPQNDPLLAQAVVAARQAVRGALVADGMAHLVEAFDPDRYGHQATVGENILFGEATDPALAGTALARHPYLRAVLQAEDLARPLVEVGLQAARSTVEIFADLPDDHPLFDAFSLFPAAERGYFEDLVARQPEAKGWRRGASGQRDRERLIGLALRYSETRHRFGLVDAAFEERIVAARRTFRTLMPAHLQPGIAFYDPECLNPAASLEENILFGRINGEEAEAETRVRALVRKVLADHGLEPSVYRLGLASRVEPGLGGGGASLGENAIDARTRIAIDLARCLVRRPDIVVVAIATEDRKPDIVRSRLAALRAARAGTGLIVCVPDESFIDPAKPFDAVLAVERSTVLMAA